MLEFVQIRRAKCGHEVFDEFILRLLRQCYAQQFELFRRFALTNIMSETKIPREADFKVLDRKFVKPPIVETLHPQRVDRFDLVTFRAESRDKLAREILVQQDFHAGCNSF